MYDFSDNATRTQMAAESGRAAAPIGAPSGLVRMERLWTAPLPDYAPQFVKSAGFGYLLSAMFGVGLIMAGVALVSRTSIRTHDRSAEAGR